jgi:serine/threonine protein kinase
MSTREPTDSSLHALDRQKQVFSLLSEALSLPHQEREALLAASDEELAAEVRRLIAADKTIDHFLPTEAPRAGFNFDALMSEERCAPGSYIGPYQIVELLGAGGMGTVYLAEQTDPITRQVALKVLQLHLLGTDVRRRFAAECHAMGRLDHPNVGRILDAGTTGDDVPYLAMELIDGTPITQYCNDHALGVEERLRLFVEVCRGVEHAHQKFLLHRDIKPSNILVMEVDGRPVPKLIDFGVAKTLGPSLADGLTRRELLGTPQYMSPEALAGDREIDTRADVFSLGILVYQLLTDRLPWGALDDSFATLIERRASQPPQRPSTTFNDLSSAERADAARLRNTPPAALLRRLRSDLDWIVLRSIATDPADRYSSPTELAADVERYLADQPVEARPPHSLYRLRKALERHRGAALTAAVVILALIAGTVGTSTGLLRARRAEARARAQATAAEQARAESEEVVDFLSGIFAASQVDSDRSQRPPSETTARELLELGAEQIENQLADQPRVRARLEQTIGIAYRDLGLYDEALRHLEAARPLLQDSDLTDPVAKAKIEEETAEVYLHQARVEEAGAALDRAQAALAQVEGAGNSELQADILVGRGRQQNLAGDSTAAEASLRQAVEIYAQLGAPAEMDGALAVSTLGRVFFTQNRWSEAEEQFAQAREVFLRLLPPGHPRLVTITDNLAAAIASQGRLDEAAPIFRASLEDRRRWLGDRHPMVANSLNNLGVLHRDLGEPEAAVAYHREALEIREQVLGPDHPATAWSLDNLSRALGDLGRNDEARQLQERALDIRRRRYGPDHLEVGRSLSFLAKLATQRGDYRAALPLARQALEIRRRQLPEGDEMVGRTSVQLGEILWHLGDRAAARDAFDEGLAILEAAGDSAAKDLAEARQQISALGAG